MTLFRVREKHDLAAHSHVSGVTSHITFASLTSVLGFSSVSHWVEICLLVSQNTSRSCAGCVCMRLRFSFSVGIWPHRVIDCTFRCIAPHNPLGVLCLASCLVPQENHFLRAALVVNAASRLIGVN